MDVRIEQVDGESPQWRVYLNTFFIICDSAEAAQELAQRANASNAELFRKAMNSHRQRKESEPFCLL